MSKMTDNERARLFAECAKEFGELETLLRTVIHDPMLRCDVSGLSRAFQLAQTQKDVFDSMCIPDRRVRTDIERSEFLRMCSDRAAHLMVSLESAVSHFPDELDAWSIRRAIGSLTWIAENCHVASKHALGELLADDMGYYNDLPEGMTIEQMNTDNLAALRARGVNRPWWGK